MIWHIFKKDARLLWPMAALVAALHVCAAIPRHLLDHGMGSSQLRILSDLLSALALLGVTVLVVVAMHQDPVPGTRQDWVIRPIRRRELILAKLLFVLLLVQLPLAIADVATTLADGFTLPGAAAAAGTRNLQILCEFALPSMMIGVITRTFVEAFIVWIIGSLAIDYSLTLVGPSGNYSLPATGAFASLPGLGRCGTGIDADGDDVALGCLSTAPQATCLTAHLEYGAMGVAMQLRNPETHHCFPDYSPRLIGKFWPDAIYRTGAEVRFFDRSGMVRYPVDGSKLVAARLVMTTFEPLGHFTRHVDTPVLRLADLTGLAREAR